jgi:hypothetical protein
VETDCTGDFSWEKAIEQTILRVLGSSEFSHGLDPKRKLSGTACMKNVLMVTVRLSLI